MYKLKAKKIYIIHVLTISPQTPGQVIMIIMMMDCLLLLEKENVFRNALPNRLETFPVFESVDLINTKAMLSF